MILLIMVLSGFLYYIYSTAKSEMFRKYAFFVKIFSLLISFVLAFLEQDTIIIGGFSFGGRMSVMILIVIEIVDAIIDKENK